MRLTRYEELILTLMQDTPGVAVEKSRMHHVLYGDNIPKANTLQVFIMRLRKKGYKIKSERNVGYALMAEPPVPPITNEQLKKEGLL
jgi:DNA-binding response OmpR family regulator